MLVLFSRIYIEQQFNSLKKTLDKHLRQQNCQLASLGISVELTLQLVKVLNAIYTVHLVLFIKSNTPESLESPEYSLEIHI